MKIKDEKELILVKEIQNAIQRWKTERILLVFLDNEGNVMAKKVISEGYNKYTAYFYPSKVYEFLKTTKPYACVWAHNHVNNFPTPSKADDETHYWFTSMCKKLKIIPYDSIIVMRNNDTYYSYKQNNRNGIKPKNFTELI